MNHDKFYEMYKNELTEVAVCNDEELRELSEALEMGDETVRNRIIEGCLERVIGIAENYVDQGLSLSDLVQEGNVALTMAVYEYEGGNIIPYLEERISEAIRNAVEEQKSSEAAGEKMAAYINVMNEVTARLAEELGRQATVEEVAEKMQISVEQVKVLMKAALNAV